VNLAIMLATAGKEVLLVDADLQSTSSKFMAVREDVGQLPVVTCAKMDGEQLRNGLKSFAKKFEHIIVDVGGRDSAGFRAAILSADVLLVPTLPGQFDCWEHEAVANIAEEVRLYNPKIRCLAVINCADTNPKSTATSAVEGFLATLSDFKLVQVNLGYRVAYRHAAGDGLSICELPQRTKDKKAIAELSNLYKEIYDEDPQNS
jgi:chromosome partitioning protein